MELAPEAIELARWLVLEHLRLARVSQRRDLSDPRTIETFAGFIRPPGELHALAVLTWADATSVSPQGTLSWKIELLRGLYEATRHYLHGTPAPAPHLADRPPMQAALRDGSLSDDTLRWLTAELSDAHWAAFNDDELGTAVAMLAEAAAAPTLRGLRLDADGAAGSAVLWVCTKDRPRLLFDLTAGIAADRVNILRARIFTTKSGWVVDRFDLDWTDPGGKALSDRRSKRLLATIEDVLSGATNTATLRQKWQSESKAQPRHRQPIPLNVKRAHEPNVTDLVIVEVKCRDRIGLLADLSLALWELGFEIDRSIISSEGERAVDTFYVRPNTGCTVAADDLAAVLKARMELTDGSHSQPG
jgi:[protein-PII] uridylyltransferase